MNRAYQPERSFTSCYIPGATAQRGKLDEVIQRSKDARVPNYVVGDEVEWDLGDGKGRQRGAVEEMREILTRVRRADGSFARLAPDRPRRSA